MNIDIRVLGPLEVRLGERPIHLGTPKQRTVLALLVLHAGRPVSVSRLVDELWPESAPESAVANVTTYVSRLRRSLSAHGCELDRRDAQYVLTAAAGAIDLRRFAESADRGDAAWRAGDVAGAAAHYSGAVRLWRGDLVDGVTAGPELSAARAEWDDRRLAVFERSVRARLRLGYAAEESSGLRRHTGAEPLRETGWQLLMAALHLAGNPAAALEAYARAKDVLAARLGVDPGPGLRDMHRAVLRSDDAAVLALLAPAPAPPAARPEPVPAGPAQLPLEAFGFVGRRGQLDRLDAVLLTDAEPAARIAVVSGTAGVGKTALAVHWAHRVRDRFPDGQLHVNLQGFDPAGAAVRPAVALRRFLEAFGVPPQRIPSEPEALAGAYRSLLADRRVLIVLDNAADAEQVRPLLPGSAACRVLVTSRNQLSGLVAAEGARPIALDLFSGADASRVLAHRLGEQRLEAEPTAAGEIVERCARLPLALAIVAARAAIDPDVPLASLAATLRDTAGALDLLGGADPLTDMRAVLSWSYRQLGPDAAALFRLLGLHPGPDVTADAAASLAGAPVDRALCELAEASLVAEQRPGRFVLHDVLRAYASELAERTDPEPDRRAATTRMLDHYTHSLAVAARLISWRPQDAELPPPAEGTVVAGLADEPAAEAWLHAEEPALHAALDRAVHLGLDRYAVLIPHHLLRHLHHHARWEDVVTIQTVALRAAERLGDVREQVHARRTIAGDLAKIGKTAEAYDELYAALDLAERDGYVRGMATTRRTLSYVCDVEKNFDEALEHDREALALYQRLGDRWGEASAHNGIAWTMVRLGRHAEAIPPALTALALFEEDGNRAGQAHTLDSLGFVHRSLGDHEESLASFRRALELFRVLGDQYRQGVVLENIGDTLSAADRAGEAAGAWREALDIFAALDQPEADGLRRKLDVSSSYIGPR
ncbi:BTAD domain-containing putative transcriptional regulator [Actinoplanes sp. NBRC 103695]|uniref:AfsR/SARP family transcriptional regulator n=1 Tax=Actinoplanes sp. NBRC 103695 TaxID=3032202 RepID=UPI0024A3187B|nr:BTAD domain-containing putative transcriptional regulator [Actinoplanes sp. NBRC 103695]GLY93176.1 SARP family transcriptional regulator [Actinoplanes sp. NBRC 103695]